MRIAIIHAGMDLVGGIERIISTQANYWAEKGHEVILLTHRDPTCKSFFPLLPSVINVYTGDLPCRSTIDIIPGVYSFRVIKTRISQLRSAIKKVSPDIVITTMHGSENFFLDKCVANTPIIGVNHISYNLRIGSYERTKIKKIAAYVLFIFQLRTFRKYRQIVTLSKTEALIWNKLGCNSIFIPNSVDSTKIKKHAHVCNKTIVTVGRLDYLKGHDRLLDVWERIANKYPDWTLLFIGDGPLMNIYKNRSKETGIERQIQFLGKRDDVYNILSSCSIFAFTSRSESFGMVILEALSCGIPVITYDCENGPRDIIDNYYNGFIIKDGDIESYIKRLEDLINNCSIRDSFSKNGYKTIERFDNYIVMEQWKMLLESM